MRRFAQWLAFALAFIVSGSAWAYMPASSKGVYYAGNIHYISVNEDQKVFHTKGTVQSGETWEGPWESTPDATMNLTSGWKRQDPQKYGVGEATVVVGALIVHYAALIDPSGARWLCVSRFDANTNTFVPTDANATGEVHPYAITKMTGSDTGHYAMAATVFGDKIYVFSNEFTMFSADSGKTHSRLPAVANGLTRYNARDAITFFPEEGMPKIMVAFSDRHNDPYGVGWMGFVIWDGVATLPLPSTSIRGVTSEFIGTVVLALGTSAGRSDTFGAGAKVPCIQMVASSPFLARVLLWEYRIPTGSVSYRGADEYGGEIRRLRVFPWYESEIDPLGRPVLKQFIGINFYHCLAGMCAVHQWERYALKSDFMLPIHQGPDDWGWQGIPTDTGTGTPAELAQRKSYWSLLGVILGPAPFATNEKEAFEINGFSNVEYGSESSSAIEHKSTSSNTVMASSKTEIKAGFGNVSLEATYKHAWESSRSAEEARTVGLKYTAGTANEDEGSWGQHGWAIFSTPTFLSQTHALYAYDYDITLMSGTDLNLRLPTIVQAQAPTPDSPPSLTINGYYFSLANPGGADDHPDIQGLLEGMPAYPNSTNLEAWHAMNWDFANAPFKLIYGTGAGGLSAKVPTVSQGGGADISFGQTTKNIESKGQSNSVDIQVGASFDVGIVSETLTAGYAGEWKVETTNTTEFSNSVMIRYHMPFMSSLCQAGDCVKDLIVQPYVLQATDYTAPWIPTKYSLNLPWAITWRVNFAELKNGTKIGIAPPPASIAGTVIGGDGAGALAFALQPKGTPRHHRSSYEVNGGRMSWLNEDGTENPIPIGADEFNPQVGAFVRLNGYELATSSDLGTWKRKGGVWEYKTNRRVQVDAFKLTLDFGKNDWHLTANGLELADVIRAGDKNVRVELHVNDIYVFTSDIEHKTKTDWNVAELPPDDGRMHLTNFEGAFDSDSGDGTMTLHGVLPQELPEFGDITLIVNGHERQIPLLVLEQFRDAFESGQVLPIQRPGVNAVLDFGNKTWTATIDRTAFHPLFAPRWGCARVKVLVGGVERASKEHRIPTFATNLRFKR